MAGSKVALQLDGIVVVVLELVIVVVVLLVVVSRFVVVVLAVEDVVMVVDVVDNAANRVAVVLQLNVVCAISSVINRNLSSSWANRPR